MIRAAASATLLLAAAGAGAQAPDPLDIRACKAIESDAQRLACYDRATHRDEMAPVATPPPATGQDMFGLESGDPQRSLLDSRWELAPESKLGTFNLRGYQPIYIMPLFATSDRNETPRSPNPNNTVSVGERLDSVEAKFQLSFKTKVWQGVFGDKGDVWATY